MVHVLVQVRIFLQKFYKLKTEFKKIYKMHFYYDSTKIGKKVITLTEKIKRSPDERHKSTWNLN